MNSNGLRWTAKGVHPGDERLAAFVDGRLSSRERSRIVDHLASCEECYEVFSETVSVQSEAAEEGETIAPVPSLPARRSPWRRPVVLRRWVPAAALLAAAITIVVLAPWRDTAGTPHLPVGALVPAEVGAETADEVRSRIDAHGWPQTLGPESYGEPAAAAFQLGVRAVELEVALAAGDREASVILSHRIDALLAGFEAGEVVSHVYYAGPGGLREMLAEDAKSEALLDLHREADAVLAESSAEVPAIVDPFWYGFGKWAQAGYLAAAEARGEHFRSPLHRSFLRHLRKVKLPPEIREMFGKIDVLLRSDEASFPALTGAFGELVTVAGGGAPPDRAR